MRSSFVAVAIGLLAAVVPATFAFQQSVPPKPEERVRVGVYDSRGIAIAYAASKHNEAFLKATKDELDAARKSGDAARVREIEAQMEARQHHFHEMGFGAADVSALLDPVRARLPELAEAAGVDVIVSRFEIEFQRPGLELVNVTEPLVELFDPNERTRAWVREAQKKEPVPLASIKNKRP